MSSSCEQAGIFFSLFSHICRMPRAEPPASSNVLYNVFREMLCKLSSREVNKIALFWLERYLKPCEARLSSSHTSSPHKLSQALTSSHTTQTLSSNANLIDEVVNFPRSRHGRPDRPRPGRRMTLARTQTKPKPGPPPRTPRRKGKHIPRRRLNPLEPRPWKPERTRPQADGMTDDSEAQP